MKTLEDASCFNKIARSPTVLKQDSTAIAFLEIFQNLQNSHFLSVNSSFFNKSIFAQILAYLFLQSFILEKQQKCEAKYFFSCTKISSCNNNIQVQARYSSLKQGQGGMELIFGGVSWFCTWVFYFKDYDTTTQISGKKKNFRHF